MLSDSQLQDVCLLYDGGAKMCRYLRQDGSDYNKWYCVKQKTKDRDKIDEKVAEHVRDCRKQNVDPADTGVPLGDNCAGYPVLKFILQGYDVDKKTP